MAARESDQCSILNVQFSSEPDRNWDMSAANASPTGTASLGFFLNSGRLRWEPGTLSFVTVDRGLQTLSSNRLLIHARQPFRNDILDGSYQIPHMTVVWIDAISGSAPEMKHIFGMDRFRKVHKEQHPFVA
jgi:hypothetical protein